MVRLLRDLTGSLRRALAWRAHLATAFEEVIVEVAFVWAHYQLVSKPTDALDEQVLFFGLAGTLDGVEGMLMGKFRLRELERWELLFAGIMRSQSYCDRYSDDELSGAIARVKARLCPPPRAWPRSRVDIVGQHAGSIESSAVSSRADRIRTGD